MDFLKTTYQLKNKISILSVILLLLLFSSCDSTSSGPDNTVYERGEVISSKKIISYTKESIALFMSNLEGEFPYEHKYGVDVFSITYQTVDDQGNKTRASGALMVPEFSGTMPFLTVTHGTETKKTNVASVFPTLSSEGFVGLATGSMGYVTSIPDYTGMGVSDKLHPFVHARSLALAVIDFMRASRNYCDVHDLTLSEKVFLTGYSEGGYAAMATQKEIEASYATEFTLTAVAPMAGPYNLLGTAETLLQKTEYQVPMYISYVLTAYNDIYGWDKLNIMFNDPYAGMMPDLFDGTNSYSEVNNQLPTVIRTLLKSDYVDSFLDSTETDLRTALADNNLLDWTPVTPMKLYHGDADSTVFYQNSLDALQRLTENGATDIELITIPDGTHESAGFPAFVGAIGWFETLK